MIDAARVREDTPGCHDVIHLNNAGSSLPPRSVVDTVVDYLRLEERVGGYEALDQSIALLDHVYGAAARLLTSAPDEIAFTSSASDAWWRAFSAIPLVPGDRVLLGRSEFQTSAFGLLQAAERGIVLDVIPNADSGEIDLDALDARLDDDVKLICLTHISMSNGAVQPAASVGHRARSVGAIYLLDACQSAGQMPLDVEDLGADFVVFTGRKFVRGPRGTGILYARRSVIDRLGASPFVDGRSAEWTGPDTYEFSPGARRFEFGEQYYAGKAGLGVAIDYALDLGLTNIQDRVTALADALRGNLDDIPGVVVHDEGTQRSGIVTFTVDGQSPVETQVALSRRGINVSAPGKRNAQLDLGARGLDAVVRAGVHYYNTATETAALVSTVRGLAGHG